MKQLHSTEDAIEQAIEGGWKPKGATRWPISPELSQVNLYDGNTLTDPLFWQALGKAQGWEGEKCDCVTETCAETHGATDWKWQAIKWFENRMAGGDEQKFWESLP